MKLVVAPTVALAMLVAPSQAQFFVSGNDLLARCQDVSSVASQSFCNGFILSTFDTHLSTAEEPLFCSPEGVEASQIVAVVKNYLEDHPEVLHVQGALVSIRALRVAFGPPPC